MKKSSAERNLIPPYGEKLVNLMAPDGEREALADAAGRLPAIRLSPRAVCDLELLITGAFSPLDRFMGKADYARVLAEMRLANGMLFPIPITLPADPDDDIALGKETALRTPENEVLALMRIEETYEWDAFEEARSVCGTTDVRHPLVAEMASWGKLCISGELRGLRQPTHLDFAALRHTPGEVRGLLGKMGYSNVVAFQTRNPMHRIHEELTKRAAQEISGALLIQPVVGLTKPGDVDYFTRVRTYKALVEKRYDPNRTLLSLLPLAMRMAGPREAIWHGIVRRNYGANHLIIGRDHAGPGLDSMGRPFYGPYDAQELFQKHADEIGVRMVDFGELVYLPGEDRYEEKLKVPEGAETLFLSGTQVREEYLARGRRLPEWFSRTEVADILHRENPPQHEQGFCVWFTGLPSAGKSTLAQLLAVALNEQARHVTLLDGDVVRTHLSKGLGFSREDRDTNIRRIGFVASEIVKHNGVAIGAAVSPYRATRSQVRTTVGPDRFVLVFVATPLDVCEQRDVKNLYARARRGEIRCFTGIDDPYEDPESPDVRVTTVGSAPEEDVRTIVEHLAARGFLKG